MRSNRLVLLLTAYTGFAAITATVIAFALVAGGVLFVVIGRRRRV